MADVLGPMNLLDKALPLGVDGTRLAEWALRDGITYGQLAQQLALALGDANEQLIAKWGFLFSITEELMMEYENGGSVTEMDELTDSDKAIPVRGDTIGHMLPLRAYANGIGGTKRYWRDARSAKVRASISTLVRRGIWRFEKKLLGRFFSNAEEAIGSSGYSVPFVRGTGGSIDFVPVPYDGEVFTSSHNHFIGYDSDTNPKTMADVLDGLVSTLAEHGHDAPYFALVSRDDIATFGALTKKVVLVESAIQILRGGVTTGPQFYASGQQTIMRIGSYQSDLGLIDLMASARIPTGYVGAGKSYGQLDARNPLAVRVHPARGFGLAVVPETAQDPDYPISQLDVDFEFGIGVGMDRTNGACGYLSTSGSWANPTIE